MKELNLFPPADALAKKPKARSKNHEVIGRFLETEKAATDKYFWPREMKLAGKLIKKYPLDFLLKVKEPFAPARMNSLAWFISKDGQSFLSVQFFEFKKKTIDLSVKKPEIVLSQSKIGEDTIIQHKPRTLKEFLQHGKSNQTREKREESGNNPTGANSGVP